jgi:general L-amino acid transport system substrate-binding protein
MGLKWIGSALAVAAVALFAADANAAYRMCALRDGPKGPCTCQGSEPGQFQAVSRKFCRPAAVAKKPEPAPEAVVQPAPNPEPPLETGTAEPAPAVAPAPPAAAAPPAPAADPAPALDTVAPASATLARIRARDRLLCGVNDGLLGFSLRDATGRWTGLDADFCRAVAAAVFGDSEKVEFVAVSTNDRFDVLAQEKIDILARNTTWTMSRDVDMGFDFAGVLYYDGQGFLTGSERGLVSAQQLSGAKVCVEAGTTSEKNMDFYFKANKISAEVQAFASRAELIKAYAEGTCEAFTTDTSALYAERAQLADPSAHTILPEVISKEPLGPLVKGGDPVWTEVVRWTLAGLVNAEEVGLDRAASGASSEVGGDALRLVSGAGASGEKLGLSKTWLRTVVAGVGNYGEMFEANVGKSSPLGMNRGINALWKRGGLLYAPPMW